MHTTDGWFLSQIKEAGAISVTECKVFTGQSLSYFYYGRPAYRPSYEGAVGFEANTLVSFVIDTAKTPAPTRIFPFDSGAMANNLYADFLHPKMRLEHFELSPDPELARKIVQGFFGTNDNYFAGRGLESLAIPVLDHEAAAYHAMAKAKARSVTDDRRTSIEFQFATDIPLSRDNVLAVVLPETWWDDPEIADYALDHLRADKLSYRTFQADPAEDVRGIMMAVSEYLKSRRLL